MNEQSANKMPLVTAWQGVFRLAAVTRAAKERTGDKCIGTEVAGHNGTEPTVRVVRVIPQGGRKSPIIKHLTAPLTFAQAEQFLKSYEFSEVAA